MRSESYFDSNCKGARLSNSGWGRDRLSGPLVLYIRDKQSTGYWPLISLR
jgi:hypothetical protein